MAAALIAIAIVVIAVAMRASMDSGEPSRTPRLLGGTKRFTIAKFPAGWTGRIVGNAASSEATLTAPLTGRPCVYFEVTVDDPAGESWHHVIRETSSAPFVVEDGTGRAVVDLRHARIRLTATFESTSGIGSDPSPAQAAVLARHGVTGRGPVFNTSLRYQESVVQVGQTVVVVGRGVHEPDPDPARAIAAYRAGPPMRLRIGGTAKTPVLIGDEETIPG